MKPVAKRLVFGATFAIGLAAATWQGWRWWNDRSQLTDNAYVHADITAISPKVAGYVSEVLVADNQTVEAGTVLLRIADDDYHAQRDRARAAVAQVAATAESLQKRKALQLAMIAEAKAAIDVARADVELSDRELARVRPLLAQGWAPQRNHDAATANADRSRANLARAEAVLSAAQLQLGVLDTEATQIGARAQEAKANLQLADIHLSETVIRAPIRGVVGNRRVRDGEYVKPGGVLLSIVPLEGIWVVANFKETEVSNIHIGQEAKISVDGYPGTVITGWIDSLAPASGAAFSLLPPDNATGNFVKIVQRIPTKVRLEANHALQGRLVPGMSVRVSIGEPSQGTDYASTSPDRTTFRTVR